MLNRTKLEVVSASSIQMFLACRQKYWLRYVAGWEAKEKARALEFGGAFDKAIERLHTDWDVNPAIVEFESRYEDKPHDDKRTRAVAARMIRGYAMQYRDQPFTTLKNKFRFKLAIPEIPGVHVVGEIDRVIDWHGRRMVDELKTTSQLTADYMQRFWVDYQTAIYLIAARRLVDPEITAILADACLVSKTDPSKLKSSAFLRDVIEKTPEQLEYMRTRLVQIIDDMRQCHDEGATNDRWYENDQACTQWNGCQYLRKCKHPRSMQERVLASDFVCNPNTIQHYDGKDFTEVESGEFTV